jgi:geranylgeranyl pyrophosphate synthase
MSFRTRRYFHAFLEEDLKRVEDRIKEVPETRVELIESIYRYVTESVGKMIRPALLLLAAKAVGEVEEEAIELAAIVELIHIASMVHDDILDEATTRRSRPTVVRKWGIEGGLLFGDFLISIVSHNLSDLNPRYTKLVSKAIKRMCEGEFIEFFYPPSVHTYLKVIRQKTAILMTLASQLGAIAGGGRAEDLIRLGRYGMNIGMAFQIVDDILDLVGDEEIMGKDGKRDIKSGKLTLPVLYALEGEVGSGKDIMSLIEERKGIEKAYALSEEFVRKAKKAIDPYKERPAWEAMMDLADYILSRDS